MKRVNRMTTSDYPCTAGEIEELAKFLARIPPSQKGFVMWRMKYIGYVYDYEQRTGTKSDCLFARLDAACEAAPMVGNGPRLELLKRLHALYERAHGLVPVK
jgi:hypothetical protein